MSGKSSFFSKLKQPFVSSNPLKGYLPKKDGVEIKQSWDLITQLERVAKGHLTGEVKKAFIEKLKNSDFIIEDLFITDQYQLKQHLIRELVKHDDVDLLTAVIYSARKQSPDPKKIQTIVSGTLEQMLCNMDTSMKLLHGLVQAVSDKKIDNNTIYTALNTMLLDSNLGQDIHFLRGTQQQEKAGTFLFDLFQQAENTPEKMSLITQVTANFFNKSGPERFPADLVIYLNEENNKQVLAYSASKDFAALQEELAQVGLHIPESEEEEPITPKNYTAQNDERGNRKDKKQPPRKEPHTERAKNTKDLPQSIL